MKTPVVRIDAGSISHRALGTLGAEITSTVGADRVDHRDTFTAPSVTEDCLEKSGRFRWASLGGFMAAYHLDRPIGRRQGVIVALFALSLIAAIVLSAAPSRAALSFTFKDDGYSIYDVEDTLLPYNAAIIGFKTPGENPAWANCNDGVVPMFCRSGQKFYHPVNAAQWGLSLMSSYRLTHDMIYLTNAEKVANTLLDSQKLRRTYGNAYYFAYPFQFARHSLYTTAEIMRPPWYSGMAQGQALSLFTRIAQAERARGNSAAYFAYHQAADYTFRSFTIPLGRQPAGSAWTIRNDSYGYLWLEEYAQPIRPPDSDYTINGHIYSAFGLYDYYREVRNRSASIAGDAKRLLSGAGTAVRGHFAGLRRQGWISKYCLAHGTPDSHYHVGVMYQLLNLFEMTHADGFASFADSLNADYPDPRVTGTVSFAAAGTYTGYRFDSNGNVTARKSYALARASSAPFGARTRIIRNGYFYQITSGVWAGYYIPEMIGRVFKPGIVAPLVWNPTRTAHFTAGRAYSAYRFDLGTGAILDRQSFVAAATVAVRERGTINGANGMTINNYVQLASGLLAGYWVPGGALPIV